MAVTYDSSVLGEDLDAHLAASEVGVANLKTGAEKEIIWFDQASKSKTPLSVIYIHGFSATKHEIRPVPDNVARALGANLYFTRITGHGRDGAGMGDATLKAWSDDFAEAIAIGERLGERIIVLATSNGGALTTWGLSNPELAKNVAGVVFFSPAYALHDLPGWLANIPWAETLLPLIAGEERSWEPRNELQGKWWTTSYPSKAVFPMTSLQKNLSELDPSSINTPALFFYAPQDRVVIAEEIEKVATAWGGTSEMVKITEASDEYMHVITGDIMAPENTASVSEKIIDWTRSLGN